MGELTLRWVEKSGQAPHWTTFVLDAGALTFTVRAADKTPPKVECRPTVFGFAREQIFSTKAQSENQSSNLAKMLIRSTSPALLQNRCYSQWYLSDVLANYCKYYLSLPLSYWSVWLCIFLFLKGRIFLIQFLSALER